MNGRGQGFTARIRAPGAAKGWDNSRAATIHDHGIMRTKVD